jgi:hypothetical protein
MRHSALPLAFLAVLAAAPAWAQVYQCTDAAGRVTFRNQPCGRAERPRVVIEKPKPASKSAEARPPEGPAPEVAVAPIGEHLRALPGSRIDASVIQNPAWREAVERVGRGGWLRKGKGRATLLRVRVADGDAEEEIQLRGTKLRRPDEGDGGTFAEFAPGSFVVYEHIASTARENGRDPLEIGSYAHGQHRLWLDVPEPHTLSLLGDVVLERTPAQMLGEIAIEIASGAVSGPNRARIGPVTAGGRYGRKLRIEASGVTRSGTLAPGRYTLVFPDFDPVSNRWKIDVAPGRVTELRFAPRSEARIEKLAESQRAGLR